MHVVATAGHVDHGKSTLVRALTGMEPDRWAEERRRGMTIDLGYAWLTLPSGAELAFVDVPGHQRFIGNMLAGLGPAPAVLFVVAADEGWSRQSTEHLAAVDALGIGHGVLAVTRSDLADPAATLADSRDRIASSSLGAVEAIAVSGVTGSGVAELRAALDRLVAALPVPDPDAPARLWIDRVFTVRGAGTVVTGTLAGGRVRIGDALRLNDATVTVRGIQCLGLDRDTVTAPARVALNLRGVARDDAQRGDALLAPDAWRMTQTLDVRLYSRDRLPEHLVMHVGSAALPVRLRHLGQVHGADGADRQSIARVQLPRPVPVRAGDRAVLRDPGRQSVAAGALVLDADPPQLRRRGAGVARARELADATGELDAEREIARRGAMPRSHLQALGGTPPAGTREVDGWLIDRAAWRRWLAAAGPAVDDWIRRDALAAGMPLAALRRALELPSDAVATAVAEAAALPVRDGRVEPPAAVRSLGPAEDAVRRLEERLRDNPFAAPDAGQLDELRLGRRELAAAERAGRLLRISDDIVLLPDAAEVAVQRLRALPQPFTASDARAALDTTRRVAIPLLEHLDARGDTERVDSAHRRIR